MPFLISTASTPGLSDEDVFGTSAPMPATPLPPAPAAPVGLSDADVFGTPEPVAAAPASPSFGAQFGANAGEGFDGGSMGALSRLFADPGPMGQVLRTVTPLLGNAPMAGAMMAGRMRAPDATAAPLPPTLPWYKEPTLSGKIAHGGTALAGQLVGAMGNPENLVGLGLKIPMLAKTGIGRMFAPAIEGAANNIPGAIVGNLASQGADVATGAATEIDPVDLAINGALGGIIGGAFGVGPQAAAAIRQRLAARRAGAIASGTHTGAPDAPPSADDVLAAVLPEDVTAMAAANGMAPDDPRLARLQEVLERRRAAEADPLAAARQRADTAPISNGEGRIMSPGAAETPGQRVAIVEPQVAERVSAEMDAGLFSSAPPDQVDALRQAEIDRRVRSNAQVPAVPEAPPSVIQMGDATAQGQTVRIGDGLTRTETSIVPTTGTGDAGTAAGARSMFAGQASEATNAAEAFRLAELRRTRGEVGSPGNPPEAARLLSDPQSRVVPPDTSRVEVVPSGTRDIPPVVEIRPEPPSGNARVVPVGDAPPGQGDLPAWLQRPAGESAPEAPKAPVPAAPEAPRVETPAPEASRPAFTPYTPDPAAAPPPAVWKKKPGGSAADPSGNTLTIDGHEFTVHRNQGPAGGGVLGNHLYIQKPEGAQSWAGDPGIFAQGASRGELEETVRRRLERGAVAWAKKAEASPAAPTPEAPASGWSKALADAKVQVERYTTAHTEARTKRVEAEAAHARLLSDLGVTTKASEARYARDNAQVRDSAAAVSNAKRSEAAIRQNLDAATGRAKVAQRAIDGEADGTGVPYRDSYPNAADNAPVTRPIEPPPPQRLYDAVRAAGGIKDAYEYTDRNGAIKMGGGDIKAMGGGRYPGVINNKSGLSLDQMAVRMKEQGFLNDGIDGGGGHAGEAGDLAGMLRERLGADFAGGKDRVGSPQYPVEAGAHYADELASHTEMTRVHEQMAEQIGLTPDEMRGLSRGQLADLIAEHHSFEDVARLMDEADGHLMDQSRYTDEAIAAERDRLGAEYDAAAARDGRAPMDEDTRYAAAPDESKPDPSGPSYAEGVENPGGREGEPGAARTGSTPDGRSEDVRGAGNGEGEAAGQGRGADSNSGQADIFGAEGDAGPAPRGESPDYTLSNDPRQETIPGTEGTAKQAIAARDAAPNSGKGPQAGMDAFDMFDPDARNQLPLADDAARVVNDLRSELSSSGFLNPRIWKAVFGPITKAALEPFAKAAREMREAFASDSRVAASKDARVPRAPAGKAEAAIEKAAPSLARTARQVAATVRAVTYGDDSAMRALADRLPDAAKGPLHDFLDVFHALAGENREAKRTFAEGVTMRTSARVNELSEILGPSLETPADLAQIVRMVQNPSSIRAGTRMGDAANGLKKWLAEHHAYMKASGLEVGEIKNGYFPRRLNIEAVWGDQAGFKTAATKAFRDAGMAPKDAAASAESWMDAIRTNGTDLKNPMAMHGDNLGADFIQGRTLPKSADQTLASFLHDNPAHVLVGYARTAAQRGEFARVMGKDNVAWTTLVAKLKAGGADAILPKVEDYVRTQTGQVSSNVSYGAQKALGWVRALGTISLMEHATITSLTEPFTTLARTGFNLPDLWHQTSTMTAHFFGRASSDRARELAEDIGTMVSHLGGSMAAARWVGGEPASMKQAHVMGRFFRAVGLEQFSHGMNVGSTSVADRFVMRMSSSHGAAGRAGREAKFSLGELGIPDAKAVQFAAWMKVAGKDGMDVATLRAAPPGMAELYRTAVFRFTRQVHMQPGAATRPRWASTPLGGAAFALSSYAYALHTNVLMRPIRALKSGDLTAADKSVLAVTTAAGLLAAVPAQMVLGELRSRLLDSKEQRKGYPDRAVGTAFSRAGLMGAVDPYFQVLTGLRYHRDLGTSIAGPYLGRMLNAGSVVGNVMQGENIKDSGKRKLATVAYDIGLKPAANFAAAGLPLPIAAVVAQFMGAGSVKEAFVSGVAAPPPPKRIK